MSQWSQSWLLARPEAGPEEYLMPVGPPDPDIVPRVPLVEPVAYDSDGYPSADGNEPIESQPHAAAGEVRARRPAGTLRASSGCLRPRRRIHQLSPWRPRRAAVGPDVFVAFGTENRLDRPSYKVWEEPAPAFVLEVLSPKTHKRDRGVKQEIYHWMGVQEYWIYDHDGRWLPQHLLGARLSRSGGYERIRTVDDGSPGVFRSEALGLLLWHEDGNLRFHDPETGQDLLSNQEQASGSSEGGSGPPGSRGPHRGLGGSTARRSRTLTGSQDTRTAGSKLPGDASHERA